MSWAVSPLANDGVGLFVVAIVLLTGIFGGRARTGIALGAATVGFLAGSTQAGVEMALASFVAATVCVWLGATPHQRTVRSVGRSVGVGVVTLVAYAATAGVVAAALRRSSFALVFEELVVAGLFPALASILVLVLIAAHPVIEQSRQQTPRLATGRQWKVVGVVLLWGLGGYLTSNFFRVLTQLPKDSESTMVSLGRTINDLPGVGSPAIVVLGTAALLLLANMAVRERGEHYDMNTPPMPYDDRDSDGEVSR